MRSLAIFLLWLACCSLASACSANCDSCSATDQCTRCIPGYQLLMDSTCKQMNSLQGCQMYTLLGRCGQCMDGFNLFSGFCYPPIANCDQYGPGNTCAQCSANFSSYGDSCFQSNFTDCKDPGTALYRGMCLRVPLTNCQDVTDGICTNCSQGIDQSDSGYKLLNGLCFKIGQLKQPACQLPSLNGSCNRCVPAYYLQEGRCLNATPNNCARNFGLYCIDCQQGYVQNNGACFRPPRGDDPNCNVADLVTLECTGCNFQYRLNSTGWCVKQNFYCQTSDNTGKCTSCVGQLSLRNSVCVFADVNCILADYDNMICLRCKPGFTLSADQSNCNLLDACLSRDDASKCTSCVDSYQLIDSTCIALGGNCLKLDPFSKNCVSCATGTSLLDNQCVYATNNCLVYDLQSGACNQCEQGYYRRQRNCSPYPSGCVRVDNMFKCTTCGNGLVLANGTCVTQIDGCLYYSSTGCQFCRASTYLNQGKCAPLPKFCGIVDQQGKCLLCQPPTVQYQGRCVYFQVFCLDYTPDGNCSTVPRDFSLGRNMTVINRFAGQWDALGNMVLCQGGYTLINNNCVLKIDNCTSYDQMGACSSCADGFALNQTICINSSGICLTKQNGKCSLCTPDFAVVNGTCYGRKNFGVTFDSVGYPVSYHIGYQFTPDFGVGLALNYNCAKQNFTTGKCSECAKYYALEAGNCVVKDANCLSYNSRGICQVCNRGFKFLLGVCRSIQFCSQIASNGLCSGCYQGFMLLSGVCIRQAIMYCGSYDSDSVCTACYPGYYLTPINTCAQRPRNCDVISDQGVCTRCLSGYRMSNSQCERIISNCLSYLDASCSACQTGFSLVGGECMQLPTLCKSLDPATLKCRECFPGFVLVNNKELCANNVPRCINYNFDGSCKICTQGFYLTNNRCLNVTNRCVRYSADNACIECADPYTFSGGECRILTAGCTVYTNGTCSKCDNGLYLSKQQQCAKNPTNCLSFNPDTNACTSCISGFTVKAGSCTSNNVNMDGCAQQLSPVECKQCLPGFTLGRDGLCLATTCIRFDNGMRCLECPSRFELVGGQCASRNCASFDQNTGLCISCAAGYQVVRNGTTTVYCRAKNCQSFGQEEQCTGCGSGYSLNNNRLCSIANCFTEVNFVCFSCSDGYILKNGFCQIDNCAQLSPSGICVACIANYILMDGLCGRDPRCNLFQPNGGPCQQCNQGYSLSSTGLCQRINCDQLTPDGKCIKCSTGFTLSSDGQCLSSFCLTFDANSSCTKCTAGYSIVNGTCWISGCSALSTDGSCSQCLPRYDTYNGVCRPANCTTLTSNSTGCRECHARYTLVDGLCIPRNCITYDDKKNCAVCGTGLRPLGGFCYFINCRRFDNLRCLQCSPGFSFDGDRLCTSRSCQTYNVTTGGCLGCFTGLRLLGDICVDPYCNVTAPTGTCVSCQAGFVLDSSSYCWLPDTCLAYNADGKCVGCTAGYQLDSNSGNCTLVNCQYLDNLNNCLQCIASFVLKDRICVANFCKQYDSASACVECLVGYTLLNDGSCAVTNCQQYYGAKCIKCIPSYGLQDGLCKLDPCAQYGASGSCIQCYPTYTLRRGRCLSQFCITFDNNGVDCTQCRGGYILDKGLCIKITQGAQTMGCISYNPSNGKCTNCQSGFRLNGDVCQARNCIRADQYQCLECMQGYSFIDGNSRCLASNCVNYDNVTYDCSACETNYFLSGGQCIYQAPVECPAGQYALNRVCTKIPIRFCEAMDQAGQACARCSPIASLVAGRCFNLRNCDRHDENGCQVCTSGYFLSNTFCIPSQVQYCNISDSTGKCLRCLSGYVLLNEKCYDISQNCRQYDSSGCTVCDNGYAAQSGVCAKLGPNCASLHTNGSCQRCVLGYQISGNGSCILTIPNCKQYNFTGCNLCERTFTLSPSGTCSKMIQGCANMTDDGRCRACGPAFTMQLNNSTTPPSTICVRSVDNCLVYTSQGCLNCKVGFKMVNGACASIVAYCTQYDPNNECTFCDMGYYLSRGLCIPLPSNCLSVDNGYLCTTCKGGFVLLRGACFPENTLCLQYDQNNGTCLRCSAKGYMDADSNCLQLPDNCQEADPSTGNCLTCLPNFDFFRGNCYKKVVGCRQYAGKGCSGCLQGYSLSANGECKPDRSSCQNFDNRANKCVVCAPGFALVGGLCYKQIANCVDYANNASCSQCTSGYILTAGICISSSCQIVDNGVCKRCTNGYTLINGQCQPLCIQTNELGRCVQCASGFSLVNEVACIATIENCGNYDAEGQCSGCLQGYYMNAKRRCSAMPPFCTTSDPNGVCQQCITGYGLTNGFCLISQLPPNCASVGVDGICKQCIPQFTFLAGNCIKIPPGCASADTTGCKRCRPNLLLINGLCIPISLNSQATSTLSASNSSITSSVRLLNAVTNNSQACSNGQISVDGSCVTPVANCRSYSGPACGVCNTGFNLISGACLMPSFCTGLDIFGNCISCASGYLLSGTSCIKQILYCDSYNGTRCSNCVSGYYLLSDRSTCTIYPPNCMQVDQTGSCQECNPLSNQINGKCVLKVNYCTRYGSVGQCIGCSEGYFLYQGSCNQLPPNCQKVDDSLNCVSCSSTSILVNGLCSTPVPNCFLYDSRGSCQSCRFLYYLSRNGQCVPYPTNCVSVDQLGYCLSCCAGAYLQNGNCVSYSTPNTSCQQYDPSSNRCVRCATDLVYCVSCNRCVKLDPNCYSFSIYDFTLCTSCNAGFYLISNQCVSQPPGILQQTNGTLQCRPTYFLSGTRCFKNITLTMPMSSRNQVQSVYSSFDPTLRTGIPRIASNIFWRPVNPQNGEYIGYRTPTVVMIEAIQLQGNGQNEWITNFTLQFTNSNSEGSQFRCFSNCAVISGNTDGVSTITISLEYPIIASEIRLYPQSWHQAPSCRLEFLID